MKFWRVALLILTYLLSLAWETTCLSPGSFTDMTPFKFYWLVKEKDGDSEWPTNGVFSFSNFKMAGRISL